MPAGTLTSTDGRSTMTFTCFGPVMSRVDDMYDVSKHDYSPVEMGRLHLSVTRRRIGPALEGVRVGVAGALCDEQLLVVAVAAADEATGVRCGVVRCSGLMSGGVAAAGVPPGCGEGMRPGMRPSGREWRRGLRAGEPGKTAGWEKGLGGMGSLRPLPPPPRLRCDVTGVAGEGGEGGAWDEWGVGMLADGELMSLRC